METYEIETQWLEKLTSIFQEFQLEDVKDVSFYNNSRVTTKNDSKLNRHNERLIKLSPLFASQPKFEKVCNDKKNQLVHSGLTRYVIGFQPTHISEDLNELHKLADDLKYIVNFWGHNLTELIISGYTFSKILPTIKTTCPNLKTLHFAFEEIEVKDFENVFSNMSHFEELMIWWKCENSPLPTTLVKSIEHIGKTLKSLHILNSSEENRLPDSFASVFPRLIVLENLVLFGFSDLNQALIQSIAEIKSLVNLELYPDLEEDVQSDMYPIGNLKNLKRLEIWTDRGVTDEVLINLSNNAKNLIKLTISCTNITDNGIMALSKFTELEELDLGTFSYGKSKFITEQSVEYLFFNKKLKQLNISNCIEITNSLVIKLVQNLKNLKDLYLKKTFLTIELAKELQTITKYREQFLLVHTPSGEQNCFKSFESDKLFFVTPGRNLTDIYKRVYSIKTF